ncbi:response regulator [Propionivibrio sp.]|uniref:response regulator n=1 Tax=Propionivibrio sp. TaxID=2212460 RepID=UPI003BF3942E
MMKKAIVVESAASDAAGSRILIVDDDPMVAGMLGVSLAAAGYEIVSANSGEDALAQLAQLAAQLADSTELNGELLPDLVFLDIEMGMGIDGYETCHRLRATEATRNLPVIFLSSHDKLDDRLRAYDAGGSDFMEKPFAPDEVLRKARLAILHKRRQQALEMENQSAFECARSALTGLDDSGITLKFSRGALGCRTLRALAALTIASMGAFGINCHVQLRTPGESLTLTPQGPASPLEESVIELSRTIDRIFSFQNRLIVNYESVSLLVTNMPTAEPDLCGRIRDQAAMIAEAAELAVGNINLRTDAVLHAEELRKLANTSLQSINELRGNYRALQMATRMEFESMANTIEAMYVHLALSNHQEFTISDTVRNAVGNVLTLFESSSELDRNFAGIIDGLSKAAKYKISKENEATLNIELF